MYKSIHNASAWGKVKDVKYFLDKGVSVEAPDPRDDGTPLLRACYGGQWDVIDYLLVQGANPNGCNRVGYTPLMVAAHEAREQVVEKLLNAGADATLKTNNGGYTALHKAVDQCRSGTLIRMLLSAVNNVDVQTDYGSTALIICAFRNGKNARQVAEILLEYGADKTIRDSGGENAYEVAVGKHAQDLYDLLAP